jgi:hypothetical protein
LEAFVARQEARGNVKPPTSYWNGASSASLLLGKDVACCFGFRDLPFLAEIRVYGRRYSIFSASFRGQAVVE